MQAIVGAEKEESVAMLLSPTLSPPIAPSKSSHHPSGSLFTIFLTAPLQAFCLLLGLSGSDVDRVSNGQPALSSFVNYFCCPQFLVILEDVAGYI